MPVDDTAIIKQIDDVLAKCKKGYQDTTEMVAVYSSLLSAIRRLSPPGSVYSNVLNKYEESLASRSIIEIGRSLDPAAGVLRGLRSDYESGYLRSVVELVHADVFADFLEMAEYLLQQGFKDPAAVVIGSVLEEHLRKLCDKHGILLVRPNGSRKNADSLNSELAAAGVYSKLDQKSVTAWLDLRNKAAHGEYSEYTKDQVALMLQGVRDFATRYPA